MANNLRFQVVEEAFKKHALDVEAPSERPSEYFGKYVFSRQKMYKYLPADIYNKMIDVMDNGARLDRSIADAVGLVPVVPTVYLRIFLSFRLCHRVLRRHRVSLQFLR
mgnify:CR=1 FL=1